MKEFIEGILHQKTELFPYVETEKLPLTLRAGWDFFVMEIGGCRCLLASPREKCGFVQLKKAQKRLEQLTGLRCVLHLTQLNAYSQERMVEEGIPFVLEGRQVYLPFLGVLLRQNESREPRPCDRISFLTQRLLLTAIYNAWDKVTVTLAADYLKVSKMSVTRCFDEMESLEIPILQKCGRTRQVTCTGDRKEWWAQIRPFLRDPVLREFRLAAEVPETMILSGETALAALSMLEDGTYPTYAVTKAQVGEYGLREMKQVPRNETPGCVIQELGYLIPYLNGRTIDPLTLSLIMEKEREDPRVDMALDRMLEEYVW